MHRVNERRCEYAMSVGTSRTRLDQLLVARGHAPDVDTAVRMIMAGQVSLEGRYAAAVLTPGMAVDPEVGMTLAQPPKYVSRAGLKLEHGLKTFGVDVNGLVALDIGASTGGFTDCLLQHGAKRVYAVDSGRGQLHSQLINDERVVSMERTNARNRFELPGPVQIVVADVSFISLLTVLPPSIKHLVDGGACIALLKPQFEARRDEVPRGGVIGDETVLQAVVERFTSEAPKRGLLVTGIVESPITGDRGNREFLVQIERVSRD